MTVRPADLRQVPLFADITDEHLETLLAAFARRDVAEGETLFNEGARGDRLILLVEGEVAIRQGDADRFVLRPIAPVGELGALTGLARTTTAVARRASKVLELEIDALLHFFEKHGDIAYPFYFNLLHIVADKLVRDRHRIEQMERNIVTTQKAMKRMREGLLEQDDTPVHRMLFEDLDALIEQNRKGHYLVDGAKALPTQVRLDDGTVLDVTQISNEYAHVVHGGKPPQKGTDFSGVLVTSDGEIPISGNVEGVFDLTFVVNLDPLIDEYAQALERHLTRLQMLDVVL